MPKSKEILTSTDSEASDSEPKPKKAKKAKKSKSKESPEKSTASTDGAKSKGTKGEDGEVMYPLSHQRNISVSSFRGKPLVNIREYYEKDGKMLPGRKGISLNVEQWRKLKSYIDDVDEDLKNV